jgi:peroxiredoxin
MTIVASMAMANPPADPIERELLMLGEEYERLNNEWIARVRKRPSEYSNEQYTDDEWRNRPALGGPSPDQQMLARFFEFAGQHADSPYALDALYFVIRRRGATLDPLGPTAQLASKALQLVARDHLDDPRLPAVLGGVSMQLPSPEIDHLLNKAARESKHPATRAAALRAQARHLHTFTKHWRMSEALESKDRLTDFERALHVYVTPYLRTFPHDADKNRAEIDRLLAEVEREYRDVPAASWLFAGPAKVLLRENTQAAPQTNGELAAALRFEIEHLEPGGVAPDITGRDAEGVEFRLSDYRGKVVLITFSANWCGPCKKLYPLQRELIEKFKDRPFALLSVSMDEKVETLRTSLASGEITWRCWWDGADGPIYKTWNSPGAGEIVVIDAEGIIQDIRLHRGLPAEEFEAAIERVMRRIPNATTAN